MNFAAIFQNKLPVPGIDHIINLLFVQHTGVFSSTR